MSGVPVCAKEDLWFSVDSTRSIGHARDAKHHPMTHLTKLCLAAATSASVAGCSPAINGLRIRETPEGLPCGEEGVIEDAEDGDSQIRVDALRNGFIYTAVDDFGSTIVPKAGAKGGMFRMTAGGPPGSRYAIRVHGETAATETPYAGVIINLTDPKDTYDASRFRGVSFRARRGPGATSAVRFRVADVNTEPEGGVCGACYNDFGMDLELTEDWQQFTVPFERLSQEGGWGSPRPDELQADQLYSIQFAITERGEPFDLWVDDLAFTGCH